MYLFRVNRLADDLKHDKVSQFDEFLYLLIFLYVVQKMVPLIAPTAIVKHYNNPDYIASILMVVLGVIYTYWVNRQGDDKDFLKRFVSLSIPISIYMLIALQILIKGIVLIDYFFYGSDLIFYDQFISLTDHDDFFIWVLYLLKFTFFIYLSIMIKKVSTKPKVIMKEV